MSGGLVPRLARLGISVAFTSYQSGILYMLGRSPKGGAHVHQAAMPKPMGLSYDGKGGLLVAGGFQIMDMSNVLAPHERVNNTFDHCYVPRRVHMTGHLDAHDVARGPDGLPIFVNTRFNCIAQVDPKHSFKEVWRPSFVTDLVDEDRCHLNGMATDDDGVPVYATAVSRSNTIDGWRDRRADGGVVIDVKTNEIVLDGLSMPHSPRMYKGELWLMNSGTGELGVVKGLDGKGKGAKKATFEPRAFCPGFLRGLSFHNGFAFVGLSKPRYKRFEGLALDGKLTEMDSEPWCGIQIIDLSNGSCVDWFRIDGAVAELYDVEVLPGVVCPMTVSVMSGDIAQLITYEGRTAPPQAAEQGAAGGQEM
ncbi:TIGR03032 family protein [Rhodobacterales bacterium HKCCSP123]|nr:TIGR03032 family protein [Rhodobacterales bacterium HKCCSP123]